MSRVGTVKVFSAATGTGMIAPDLPWEDGAIPFRKSDFRQQGPDPRVGKRYCYDLASDSGEPRAINLRIE